MTAFIACIITGFKKVMYAKAAIPVYWIVNLIDRRVEAYSDPTGAVE